jgi:hypothetical protein
LIVAGRIKVDGPIASEELILSDAAKPPDPPIGRDGSTPKERSTARVTKNAADGRGEDDCPSGAERAREFDAVTPSVPGGGDDGTIAAEAVKGLESTNVSVELR